MIKYFIRPGGSYMKIDTANQIIDSVLNAPNQKLISHVANNTDYYNVVMSASTSWTVTDKVTYDLNRTAVLESLNQ